MLSGGFAAMLGNPFELAKVRLQTGSARALTTIVREDGVLALWRGVVPAVVRSGLLTALQLTVYSDTKRRLKNAFALRDSDISLHASSGMSTTHPPSVVRLRFLCLCTLCYAFCVNILIVSYSLLFDMEQVWCQVWRRRPL
jgi:hypothetical protein